MTVREHIETILLILMNYSASQRALLRVKRSVSTLYGTREASSTEGRDRINA